MAVLTEAQARAAAQKAATLSKKASTREMRERADSAGARSFDVFLSHATLDADIVRGVGQILEDHGFSVYIDWMVDPLVDRTRVTRKNAALLRNRMNQCSSLLYAQSINAANSKWMPWEVGYFDGLKHRVAILPISKVDNQREFEGVEFMGLYPWVEITKATSGGTAAFVNGPTRYVTMKNWLAGLNPD